MEINTFFRLSDKGGVIGKVGYWVQIFAFGLCYAYRPLDFDNFCAKDDITTLIGRIKF